MKALKQSISIREMQKITHQWKAQGITDSISLKLLDLYLGMPAFMNQEGIYPISNLYQICLSLKTIHTSDILTAIKRCKSFGMIWNEKQTDLLGFFTPVWHQEKPDTVSLPVSNPVSPLVSNAVSNSETNSETDSILNNNILYNINNNIYPPEDSRKGDPSGNRAQDSQEIPDGNPVGKETMKASPAKEFFHLLNGKPEEKQRVLVPIIDSIAAQANYTRPRALEGFVILVNQYLIPYFDSDPRFIKVSHTGRIVWLQNLMKTRHGQTLQQQAISLLEKELQKKIEEQRKKRRQFRPLSPFEWKDADKDIRYYEDPMDGKVEIPKEAPPRPDETAVWNVLSCLWVVTGSQRSSFIPSPEPTLSTDLC